MSSPALHLAAFEGGNALSDFRAQALLTRLQAVEPAITGVRARHVHWVAAHKPLDRAAHDKLSGLLAYGEPAASGADGTLVVVMPRNHKHWQFYW